MITEMNQQGLAITWATSGGTYGITCQNLAATKARQGDEADLGELWHNTYTVILEIETGTAPTAAGTYDLYWAASNDGTNYPGGVGAADAAWKNAEEDEWKTQLELVGALTITADADTVQREVISDFTPPLRYGVPVIINETDQSARNNAGNLSKITLIPIAKTRT